jgi:hypothetical protein
MLAMNRNKVIPRENGMIVAQKVMLTIFFTGMSLTILNALPSGE